MRFLANRSVNRLVNRSGVLSAIIAGCALFSSVTPALAAERSVKSPEVTHTGKAPTGYAVTFRYVNPTAKKVQIRGEWYFTRPGNLTQISPTPDHPTIDSHAILPTAWQPGDFPLPRTGAGGGWPVAEMQKGSDGVWTFTTPLPSGTYSYSFMVDCAEANSPQCTRTTDPNNRPWNEAGGVTKGSTLRSSQVFVPSDRSFNTTDYAWQGPATAKGKLTHETYKSPGHITPKDENYLVVYTPPNYDAKRAKPYPTLWLSHGGGGNEMEWSTQGAAANILDNLINTGEIQPIVVVMPNAGGFPESDLFEAYDLDLINTMIPFVESRYHVSKSAMDRAFSGLSMGGMLTNTFMFRHPEVFQYYGMMSAGLPPEFATPIARTDCRAQGQGRLAG